MRDYERASVPVFEVQAAALWRARCDPTLPPGTAFLEGNSLLTVGPYRAATEALGSPSGPC
jgi:hypothetical protein